MAVVGTWVGRAIEELGDVGKRMLANLGICGFRFGLGWSWLYKRSKSSVKYLASKLRAKRHRVNATNGIRETKFEHEMGPATHQTSNASNLSDTTAS